MGYSKEIYRATKAKMEERRTKAERRAEQVREEVYRRVPRIEELEKELGPVDEILKDGRILQITKWLNKKIHWYGSTRTPKEVIANVCGKEVSAEPLVRYFEKKYADIYNLDHLMEK